MYRAIGIIPARMESTRFPGKPLAPIAGNPMLRHVCDAVSRSRTLYPHSVASDSPEIIEACKAWGVPTIPTSRSCLTGTERVHDALRHLSNREGDIVVNVQGDEPTIRPESLDALVETFADTRVNIASLYYCPVQASDIGDRNRVKVLVGADGNALFFTRTATAPLWRLYGVHVGVYAYRRDVLTRLVRLPQSGDLEQVAWMQNGYGIRMVETGYETAAVDAPEDVERVEEIIRRQGIIAPAQCTRA